MRPLTSALKQALRSSKDLGKPTRVSKPGVKTQKMKQQEANLEVLYAEVENSTEEEIYVVKIPV